MEADATQLEIRTYPDPVLRAAAEPVAEIDERVRAVAERMIELMREARGVGLAAPQVGLGWRLFVANPEDEPEGERIFVNPVLSEPSRETSEADEGCLSLPAVQAAVRRPEGITIEALDLSGNPVRLRGEGMTARVWQHEADHLDGILILDRMNAADRRANRRVIRELEAEG